MGIKLFLKNFRYLRKQYGLTQEQMGKKLNIKRSTYAHWESYGTSIPSCPELIAILAELGYTIEFLMTNDLETGAKASMPEIKATANNTEVINKNSVTMHLNYVSRKLNNVKQRLIL